MVHKSPSAVKFADCNTPAFTSVTPTVILTWPPAILQCNGSSLGTCISSSLAQQRHQTGALQKVTVCPFLYFTHCFHFLNFFFSLQIDFQLVIDVRGELRPGLVKKPKPFFIFWISIEYPFSKPIITLSNKQRFAIFSLCYVSMIFY